MILCYIILNMEFDYDYMEGQLLLIGFSASSKV